MPRRRLRRPRCLRPPLHRRLLLWCQCIRIHYSRQRGQRVGRAMPVRIILPEIPDRVDVALKDVTLICAAIVLPSLRFHLVQSRRARVVRPP